jgi:hypothetical protein
MLRRALLAALLVSSTGCAYTVRLLANPEGARVRLPDGTSVVTPTEVRFRWTARERQVLFVEADG